MAVVGGRRRPCSAAHSRAADSPSLRQADERAGRSCGSEARVEGRDEELARLRAEFGRLCKAEAEWQLEREILRRAARYFAREMRA
jgi:transposase